MPQNATQVLVGLNPSNKPTALRVDVQGNLLTTPVSSDDIISTPTITVGTITAGGTFQLGLAADTHRLPGGIVQNHGTGNLSVSFTTVALATAAKSIIVGPSPASLLLSQLFGANPYQGDIAVDGTTGGVYTIVINSGTT